MTVRINERIGIDPAGFRKRGPAEKNLRAAASKFVRVAVENGFLVDPATCICFDCSEPAKLYDHRDYSRPLDVQPVCHPCNASRGAGFMPARVTESVGTGRVRAVSVLRGLRKRAGLSAGQLATLIGAAEPTVYAYENRQNTIKPNVARRILAALAEHGVVSTFDELYA